MCATMKKTCLAQSRIRFQIQINTHRCVHFCSPPQFQYILDIVMAAKANSQQMSIVQKDWENREFVEVSLQFAPTQSVSKLNLRSTNFNRLCK